MSKVYTHYGVRIEKKIGTIKNFIDHENGLIMSFV